MKVCFPFENKLVGGSYHATKLLIEHLDRRDITPFVVTHQRGPWSELLTGLCGDRHVEIDLPLPFTRPGKVSTLCDLVKCSVSLAAFLRKQKIDIVHTNEDSTAIAWSLACKLAGKAQVWHQHAVPTASRSTRLLRNRVAVLLSASDYIGQMLAVAGRPPDYKLENLFAFDEIEEVGEQAKRNRRWALGLPGDGLFLIFVGALTEQKRPMQAIEVLAQLQSRSSQDTYLHVFGDDRSGIKKNLKSYAKELGVDGSVEFMGVRTTLANYYMASDFLLAPAINEGFGRVLIEAMYYGCIVIAADSGGHREIVESGKTGVLTKPDLSEEMTSAIVSCLSNPDEKRNMALNAKKAAQVRCEHDSQLMQLLELYSKHLKP